jgi:hypothetical protein
MAPAVVLQGTAVEASVNHSASDDLGRGVVAGDQVFAGSFYKLRFNNPSRGLLVGKSILGASS